MQKPVEWSHEKNEWLLQNRGVCFEDVVAAIESGNLLAIKRHPGTRYPHQSLYIVQMREYVFAAPFVEDYKKIFLKTIFPSRAYAKKYLQK